MPADLSPYGRFVEAVAAGSEEGIREALRQVPEDERADWGYEALSNVCSRSYGAEGSLARVRILLSAGARFPAHVGEDDTPLHWAATSGFAETLRLLLQNGGRVALNTFNCDLADTPLMCAAREGSVEAARVLIEAGADVNAHNEDKIGETALSRAVDGKHDAMVELLLEHGANPDIPGWMGLSARDAAMKGKMSRHPELRRIAELMDARLRAAGAIWRRPPRSTGRRRS